MRTRLVLLCLALLAAPAAGCALVGDPCAAPVTGTATYVSGSTPPPYHHEWTVRLEATSGTLTWSPGYGSTLSWSSTFAPDAAAVARACRALREQRDQETTSGGGTLTVRWRGDARRSTRLRTSDELTVDLVRAAVPVAAWDEVRARYERWQRTQRR